jgi:predicted small lipoprotein YifL
LERGGSSVVGCGLAGYDLPDDDDVAAAAATTTNNNNNNNNNNTQVTGTVLMLRSALQNASYKVSEAR